MAAVQRAIRDTLQPNPDDANHDLCDTPASMAAICKLVWDSVPVNEAIDPNMRAFAVLGAVSSLWFGRVQYAKAHDPNRPSSIRRAAYGRWLAWAAAHMSIPLDESRDATMFPDQRWDFPFTFDSESGDFV